MRIDKSLKRKVLPDFRRCASGEFIQEGAIICQAANVRGKLSGVSSAAKQSVGFVRDDFGERRSMGGDYRRSTCHGLGNCKAETF